MPPSTTFAVDIAAPTPLPVNVYVVLASYPTPAFVYSNASISTPFVEINPTVASCQ